MNSTTVTSVAPPIEIRMLGDFDVTIGGQSILPMRTRTESLLLSLLVLHHAGPVERDWLASQLWPDADKSGTWLTQALCRVRSKLGPHAWRIASRPNGRLQFDPSGATVDVIAFDEAIRDSSPAAHERAVLVYRGPLLVGFDENWLIGERVAREHRWIGALMQLAEHRGQSGDHLGALDLLHRAAAADPTGETIHLALMRAEADHGDYASALRIYRDFRRCLLDQHLPVSADVSDLAERIRQRACERRPSGPTDLGPGHERPAVNLPQPITGLIGRSQHLAEASAHVRANRLVTLVGTGGVGKTRLAVAVGHALAGEMADGAAIVELDAITDSALVIRQIASAVGAREESGRSLEETVASRLATRSMLLLVDNCEHVVERCAAAICALLRRCPGLRVLATSRQPLGIPGEVVWRVPSLPVPHPSEIRAAGDSAMEIVRSSPAVQLFVERARAVHAGFDLSDSNGPKVAAICHRLDGIPLAVELASARVGALSIDRLAASIESEAGLSGSARGIEPRHQTLDALVGWSHDLLSPPERRLFQRLSVFAGGWTLEAAEDVCECDDGATADLLASLVDKSLVVFDTAGTEPRYRFQETIRHYAQLRLRSTDDLDRIRDRHLDLAVRVAQDAARALGSADERIGSARLETEHDNFRAALAHSLSGDGRLHAGLRLAAALRAFWDIRGHVGEGQAYYERALAAARASCDPLAEAESLCGAGILGMAQGDSRSRAYFEDCLAILKPHGERDRTAVALTHLARVAESQADYAGARAYGREALDVYEQIGSPEEIGEALSVLGRVAHSDGAYDEARQFHQQALERYRAAGSDPRCGVALLNIGRTEVALGRRSAGEALLDEGMEIVRRVGSRRSLAVWLNIRGDMAREHGDLDGARNHYREALDTFSAQGNQRGAAWCLQNLAAVERDHGALDLASGMLGESLRIRARLHDLRGIAETLAALAELALTGTGEAHPHDAAARRSARLIGAAEALHDTIRSSVDPTRQARLHDHAAACRQALGEDAADIERTLGRAMSLDASVAFALDGLRGDPYGAGGPVLESCGQKAGWSLRSSTGEESPGSTGHDAG